MNEFAVDVRLIDDVGPDGSPRPRVKIELRIDGRLAAELASVCIEPCALIASASREGEFFIGTCGCGEPGCAGVWHGIQVQHSNGFARWEVHQPYVRDKGDMSPNKPPLVYEFAASSYAEAVTKVKSFLVNLLPRENGGERFAVEGHPGTLIAEILGWVDEGFCGFKA